MDDHDKILCERLATTVDHGICKCHERHRIAALEAVRDEWCAEARLLAAKLMERDAELVAERERREAAERILLNIRQGGWVGSFTPDFNAHFARYKD